MDLLSDESAEAGLTEVKSADDDKKIPSQTGD